MNKISALPEFEIYAINQTGCTNFPTKKQFISLLFLLIFSLQAILVKIPIQLDNSDLPLMVCEAILVGIILYSWYSTLSIHPGPINDIRQFQFATTEQLVKKRKRRCQFQSNQHQICKICKLTKNQSIQHCKKCNRCVLDYYFHVSWLNTCIGKLNFTSFISLIIFTFIYQILLLITNFVVLLNNEKDNQNLLEENENFIIVKKIINKIFIGLLTILIIGTIIVILLQKEKLRKHKKQLKNKLKQKRNGVEAEWKIKKEQIDQNNQHVTQTVLQIDSIKQLQFHENTLHIFQYDQPSLFKTDFFSSSNYFNHKKQSLQIKAQKFQNQFSLQDAKSKYACSVKSHSRQYSDSFQAQNMRFQQLLQMQKIKQHKLQIKTSKFCPQKIQNKAQISLDLIKTKPKLEIQNQQQMLSSNLGYKVIKGKRKSICKIEDPIQKGRKKKFNLFAIRKKDSFNGAPKQEIIHRVSKISS